LLAFPLRFATRKVTELEPRTLHQPEKLKKLSKNDTVLLFLISESMKSVRLYVAYFQWSAGRPQAGDRKLCRGSGASAENAVKTRFSQWKKPEAGDGWACRGKFERGYRAKAAPGKGFRFTGCPCDRIESALARDSPLAVFPQSASAVTA